MRFFENLEKRAPCDPWAPMGPIGTWTLGLMGPMGPGPWALWALGTWTWTLALVYYKGSNRANPKIRINREIVNHSLTLKKLIFTTYGNSDGQSWGKLLVHSQLRFRPFDKSIRRLFVFCHFGTQVVPSK